MSHLKKLACAVHAVTLDKVARQLDAFDVRRSVDICIAGTLSRSYFDSIPVEYRDYQLPAWVRSKPGSGLSFIHSSKAYKDVLLDMIREGRKYKSASHVV